MPGERTEFRVDDKAAPIETVAGLTGTDIAEAAEIVLGDTKYRVGKSSFVLEAGAPGQSAHLVQRIAVKPARPPWYLERLSDGWQKFIGGTLAFIVLAPFLYSTLLIPILSDVLVRQIEANNAVVIDDAQHSIVPRDQVAGRKVVDTRAALETEYTILYKAAIAWLFVPVVPWLLFLVVGILLPVMLVKRLGGDYYRENGVLSAFFFVLCIGLAFSALAYWQKFAAPAKPVLVWPQDYAVYFDVLWERKDTAWPIIAAWLIPVSVVLLKLLGAEGVGQAFEKIASSKK